MGSRLVTTVLVIIAAAGIGVTLFWLTGSGRDPDLAGLSGVLVVSVVFTAVLTTINLALRWARWHFLVRRFDVRVHTRDSLRLYFATLPAIATPFYLGELVRAPLLSGRFPTARPRLYAIWLIERVSDATVLVLFLLIARGEVLALAAAVAGGTLVLALLRWMVDIPAARQLTRPAVLSALLGSSLVAWALPIAALDVTLGALAEPSGFWTSANAVASGTLLGGIAGVPLGTGITGSAAIVVLESAGVAPAAAVASIAAFRAGTAWYAVGLGCLVLLVTRARLAELVRPAFAPAHFDTIAADYQDQIPQHVRDRLLVRKIRMMEPRLARASIGSGSRLLDIGCGQGWYACELATRGYRVVAADASPEQIAQARAYAARLGGAPRGGTPLGGAPLGRTVAFHVFDAAALPFSDNTFDAAYAVNLFHHITDLAARQRAFEEVVRVLRPGGLFFLHEINTENPLFRLYMGYVFPLLCDIDEGTERWIKPSALPPVEGAEWQTAIDFFTFLPDFTPQRLLERCQGLEVRLERSAIRTWSAHYAACLRKSASTVPLSSKED